MPPSERFAMEVVSRTLVQASDPPGDFPAVLPVSNLDLILGSFHVFFIAVYPTPTAGFPAVAEAARAALPAFLSRFYPFAGRVVASASTGVPEVVCSNAGAELVVARAGLALADVDFADADASLGAIQVPFERGLALSLQLVRFACGGFSLTWGTDHLLVDGHGLTSLPNAWTEMLRTGGGLSWEPHHDRRSLFRPLSPPRYPPSLDAEFVRYDPHSLPNVLLAAALVRRNYVVEAADVDRLRAAATTSGRRATRLEALSAHVWKLLAAAVGGSDTHCRLAWLVDGRRRLDPAKYNRAHVNNYLGNVVTYASREAAVDTVASSTLADVATMAAAAIGEVFRQERYEDLVDWMETHKGVFKEGGKWTEAVGLGTGSPALVVSAFVPFRVDGDFGFGAPRLVMPWVRPGRLGSAAMTVIRSPTGDGSWLVTARMWPRLADAVEADPEAVFRPATADRLGFAAPRHGAELSHAVSRM
ncbi:coniferyl alcohol acyltransferase-like [Lolium rigidum]|uniref:coniferyl alcohol acyltransferase-like n=1 Tax=Lolium rigidum TaxID=89674 RepID=UPI001F5C97DD|nr:coniferyl alcohol acyltransferase-like [Lolium rigidum]